MNSNTPLIPHSTRSPSIRHSKHSSRRINRFYRRRSRVSQVLSRRRCLMGFEAVEKLRVRELDGVDDMNEPTMAEKLASIDLLGVDKTMDTPRKEPSHPAVPPSADSVHVLLKQALHADDHALLLDCLYTRDEKVIAKSTSHLNPSDVLKLLKSLTSMLQLRGAVLICALPWLRSLLSQHASSIVSQESSLIMLNSLYQLIESRISTFGSALQLSTSLAYLFATVPEEETEEETVPTVVYEDKDSDEESEDAMETDEDSELGSVINSPQQSDDGEVMSD